MRLSYFIVAALLLPAATLPAQSSVWKISGHGNTLYIGGTCHVLRSSDFPLPAEYEQAYAASAKLVFEMDPANLSNPAFAAKLFSACRYDAGKTLTSELSAEAYQALAEKSKAAGLPIEVLAGIKPGMAVNMVTMQELMKAGISQDGVDLYYAKKAEKDQKAIGALESGETQIALIADLGEDNPSEFVLYSMQDLEQIESMMDALIRIWREGDLKGMEALFITEMREDYPALYRSMLAERNANWIPLLEAMLQTPEIEFALVGAGHIAGPDGILKGLADRGYTVEQIVAHNK
ncbi:TraB/GumN family protein [Coraliomargarita parva]|uniref:TraB/GumN family protein n=1 Tax=Coraliomargarita parva TaxID=3014050 RepID=UPI0022B415BD|nr:TraB/GumN family protein [Coraliomargarita parva]